MYNIIYGSEECDNKILDIRVPTGTSDMISQNAIDDIERDYPNIKITIGEF